MKTCRLFLKLMCCFIYVLSMRLYAESSLGALHFLPSNAMRVNWIFSGTVISEQGEKYAYFFQMERDGIQYRSMAALFDVQTKSMIFQDENHGELLDVAPYRWHVGNSFLHFDPINDSWVLGVKTAEKNGFNFKIDMLNPANNHSKAENLRPGMAVVVSQTNSINGHIHIGKKEEHFVMAKHAWFRQTWVTSSQDESHSVNGMLCHFNDGSSLYSVNLVEPDANQGAMAGWYDKTGLSTKVSQFIRIKQLNNGPWDIQVPSSRMHFVLNDYIQQHSLTAGFISGNPASGFCLLSHDQLNLAEDKKIV